MWWAGWCWCRGRRSWSWRSGPGTRPGAARSRSWRCRLPWCCPPAARSRCRWWWAVPWTRAGGRWKCSAARLGRARAGTPRGPVTPVACWLPPGAVPVGLDGFYEEMAAAGLEYGEAFRGLAGAWRRGDEVFAEAVLPGLVAGDAG